MVRRVKLDPDKTGNSQHSLENSLSNFKTVSDRLNRVTDQVNDTFEYVEEYLNDCSIGISTGISCEEEIPHIDPNYENYLQYCKYKGSFRIGINEYFTPDPESRSDFTPWEELPRTTKLKLIKLLPLLIDRIVENVNSLISEIDDAELAISVIRNLNLGDK